LPFYRTLRPRLEWREVGARPTSRDYARRVIDRAAFLRAAGAGALVFLVLSLIIAGVLGFLLEPEPLAISTDADVEEYRRLTGFPSIIAGFLGALAAGATSYLVTERDGLALKDRPGTILAAPVILGGLWLLYLAPSVLVFLAGLVLYALGAGLAAMVAGLRGGPEEPPSRVS